MTEHPTTDISHILSAVQAGDRNAPEQLLQLAYTELRALANVMFRRESPGHTLQPTALVHEAWLKLAGNLDSLEGRSHFFAIAAKAMRQILADHAKAHRRQKRGGGFAKLTFHDQLQAGTCREFELIAFHDALEQLSSLNERHARVIELRLLGSLTIKEVADHLGVSSSTVKSDWNIARAWMSRQLAEV